jgi:hypothetical protein
MPRYTIIVLGYLAQRWSTSLAGMQLQHEPNGFTRISGNLPDQSALIRVLITLHNLNLNLLSMEQELLTDTNEQTTQEQ